MSSFWNTFTSSLTSLVRPSSATATAAASATALPRIFLCKRDDMKDGEMKEIPIEVEDKNYKVLLSRLPGPVFYCTSHLCTHYRARLVTGVLNCRSSTITCPWHVAAWDLRTGDIEEAPALKGLQRHSLQIEDESVFLLPEIEKLEMAMVDPATTTTTTTFKESLGTFIIVGGGAAGAVASVQLRASGFKGRIIVVTEEPHHPIDRIKLSKSLSTDPSSLFLHPSLYLEKDLGIEYFLDSKCTSVDPVNKTITTNNTKTLNFDKLLIATGAQPIELAIPGAKHPNCHVLRSIKDSSSILSSLIMLNNIGGDTVINVCIIGSSFIGLECAAMLSKLKVLKDCPSFAGCNVTVVGMDKVPFERTLGEDVGRWMMEMHQKVGNVTFEMEQVVKEILVSAGNSDESPSIEGVLLSDGKRIACQMVIMGVGVRCSNGGENLFPEGTFEDLHPADRSIPVDSCQRVIGRNVQKGTVFAAGDVASTALADGGWRRIEHWDVAQQQGRIAAKNMAVGCSLNVDLSLISCGGSDDGIINDGDDGDKDKSHENKNQNDDDDDCGSLKSDTVNEQEHEYNSVPFFFTMQYGKSVRFAGYIPPSTGWKRTIFTADDKSFCCYYVDGDERIIAVATLGCDPLAAHCLNLMKNGTMLSPKEIEEQKLNPLDVLLL